MTPRKPVTPARLALEALLLAGAFFTLGAAVVILAALLTPLA